MGFLAMTSSPLAQRRQASFHAMQQSLGLVQGPVGLMSLMGLAGVVDAVEVLGAFISNSSYGDGIVSCSLEIGASMSATSASVRLPYYPHLIPGSSAGACDTCSSACCWLRGDKVGS